MFGPNSDCASLGTPVRCSDAAVAGNGNTGMGNGAGDASEDITGDQWVSQLNVTAAQSYKLLVDATLINNSGFNLTFTGTAILSPTLPLHLVSFSGNKQAGYNNLQWETANEVNTKQFELERSSDGLNFVKITTLQAAGMGNNNYSYNDNALHNTRVFYRLKMIEIGGSFTYSRVIWISADTKGRVKIYPIPAGDILNLNLTNPELLNSPVLIYDAVGKQVKSFMIQKEQQQFHIGSLPPGVYILKFKDGTVERLVKK